MILSEYREAISSVTDVGLNVYSPAMLIRAFQYYACSRSAYQIIRNDHQLPSEKTPSRITSKIENTESLDFLKSFVATLKNQQKSMVLLIDEIYVKPSLSYHGGKVFGKAQNCPDELAKTVLAVMIKCLFGGPEFIVKIMPVHRLTAEFQYDQVKLILNEIHQAGAVVVAIVCDGNQLNKNFFKKFETVPGKPWLTNNNIFLLFDFVHLLKCIRNNWITEKCGEIIFKDEDEKQQIARWSDLKTLFQAEEKSPLKLSELDFVAVFPKPIERQNVKTCLKVFSSKTVVALQTHTGLRSADNMGTVKFIKMFIEFWNIVNVHGINADERFRDPLKGVITSTSCNQVQVLEKLALTVQQMGSSGRKRVKQLTSSTSQAFYHTCCGLIDLAGFLLQRDLEYVMLGMFSTDPLEKAFGKLRQVCGGSYFITAQQVHEKLSISRAKLALKSGVDYSAFSSSSSHICVACVATECQSQI